MPRLKSISDTKTLSSIRGAGTLAKERHDRQFRIAWLEFERSRKLKERAFHLRKLKELDDRLREIEAECQKQAAAMQAESPSAPQPAAATTTRRVLRY
jgi:hypothetical protein